jgi:hypothetical protein
MLHAGYEIFGIGMVALLIGLFAIRSMIRRNRTQAGNFSSMDAANESETNHEIEHRVLMYLMARKTDSVLAALAKTIQQERQKLGSVVRNPSLDMAAETMPQDVFTVKDKGQTKYARVLPLARKGAAADAIARQLHLPEAEVAMILRLNAA